jgi:hypothetical protein
MRRAAVILGACGLIAGAAALTTGPALASVGSEPGHLIFSPSSGATTLAPTWSTTDGCPTGYRGSAMVSLFTAHGRFLSLISSAAYDLTGAFRGTLDGSLAAIFRFANVKAGGSLDFAVGCYTGVAATGHYKYIQSTVVTLSSDGKSYASRSSSAGSSSTQGSTSGSSAGQQGSTSGNGQGVAASTAANSSGMGAGAEAGLIAGSCAVVVAIVGFVWYRRRMDRSRLM